MTDRVTTRAASKDCRTKTVTSPALPVRPEGNQRQPNDISSSSGTSELSLADIQKSIASIQKTISTTVCQKLDALAHDVASINTKLTDLENSVSMNSDKLIDIEQTMIPAVEKKMADEISELREKLTAMEIHSRRSNLLFYGIAERQNENVESILRDTFSHLGIDTNDATNIALVNVHRLPRLDNPA